MTEKIITNPIPTIEGIVTDIIANMKLEDKAFIANGKLSDACGLHHSLGMWIRNHYGLWHDNPLTERWRKIPSSHDIREGVDHSQDHPDNLSDKIITALWNKLNGI